jgi:hypothetical protein
MALEAATRGAKTAIMLLAEALTRVGAGGRAWESFVRLRWQ